MFKKAFTLIELLGVLIILAIIALITIPIIDKSLESIRQAAYDRAVDNIVNAARNYSVSNDLGYSTTRLPLFVSELQDEGFLTLDIKSPIDESEMNGCVWYYWDEDYKQYIFEYDNICTIEAPSIDITYNGNAIIITNTNDINFIIKSLNSISLNRSILKMNKSKIGYIIDIHSTNKNMIDNLTIYSSEAASIGNFYYTDKNVMLPYEYIKNLYTNVN